MPSRGRETGGSELLKWFPSSAYVEVDIAGGRRLQLSGGGLQFIPRLRLRCMHGWVLAMLEVIYQQ
jgi:hypothetical protein